MVLLEPTSHQLQGTPKSSFRYRVTKAWVSHDKAPKVGGGGAEGDGAENRGDAPHLPKPPTYEPRPPLVPVPDRALEGRARAGGGVEVGDAEEAGWVQSARVVSWWGRAVVELLVWGGIRRGEGRMRRRKRGRGERGEDVQIVNPIQQREVRGDHREGVAQREQTILTHTPPTHTPTHTHAHQQTRE